jgi:hypothetical protein
MKLFKLSIEAEGYDMFDSVVVAADNEEEAKKIDPEGDGRMACWVPGHEIPQWWLRGHWAKTEEEVTVEYLGEAKPGTQAGVILASYNAG